MAIIRSDTAVEVDSPIPTFALHLPSNVGKVIKRSKLADEDLLVSSSQVSIHLSENTSDPESLFHEQLSSFGGIYNIKKLYEGVAIFDKLAYRVLGDDNHSILLTPLLISSTLNVKVRKLRIHLPNNIRTHCVTITEDNKNENLIVDILTEINVLVTISLKLSYFVIDDNSNVAFLQNPNSFYDWCRYSLPYSFDVRPPLFMSGISTTNDYNNDEALSLIIALKDGGLLKLTRSSQDPLEDFIVTPFNDSSYFQNLKSRFFGKINNNNGTNTTDGSVSGEAILSIATLNDLMVTISVEKKLKMWSLSSKNILLERDLNDFLPQLLWNTDLSLINHELVHLVPTSQTSIYVSVLLPLGETYFKLFQLNLVSSDNGVLSDVALIETSVDSAVPNSNGNWLCQSCKVYPTSTGEGIFSLEAWILWTFNNHKIIQQGSLDLTSGSISWVNSINSENKIQEIISTDINETTRDLQSRDELNEFFVNHIFDGVVYNDLIVETVAALFDRQEEGKINTSQLSLRKKVLKLINRTSDSVDSLKNQWIKFDCTCKELLKISQNPISFDYDFKSNLLIVVNRYEYSVLRQGSNLELLSNGIHSSSLSRQTLSSYNLTKSDSLVQLVKLIQVFTKLFSNDVMYEFEKALVQEYSTRKTTDTAEQRMDSIFKTVIVPRINESTTNQLLEGLNSIPHVLETIDLLISLPILTNYFQPIKIAEFGDFDKSLFISSYLNELVISKEIILGLLLIIMTVDINEQMILIYTKLIKLLKFCNLNLLASQIGLSESNNVSLLSDSLLFNSISQIILQKGVSIDNSNLNELIAYTFEYTMSDEFVYFIASKLISIDSNRSACKFLPYLPTNSAISKVLEGIVYLNLKNFNEAFIVFNSSVDLIINEFQKLTNSQAKSLEPISYLTDIFITASNSKSIESSKVLCFIELSGLFQQRGSSSKALEFILQSIDANNQVPIDDPVEFNKHYRNQLWKSFKLSLSVDNYDLAHDNILKMDEIDLIDNSSDVKEMIKYFILSLLNGDCIDKLLNYSFGKNCDEVDKRIYEIGEAGALNGELGTSLRYYRICYTWRYNRLGDYRGAAQALYRFNKIFEMDRSKRINKDQSFEDLSMRIIENYIIIQNALSILPDDEQWLIQNPIMLLSSEGGLSDDNGMDLSLDDEESNKLVFLKDIDNEFKSVQRAQLVV